MPETVTNEERFKKTEHSRERVEAEAQIRLDGGAKSSVVESRGEHWVLITVEEVVGGA